tara:strand:+ start:62 stop:337 length:276 start_codon:yes stop_codon:yes gene_type:complete
MVLTAAANNLLKNKSFVEKFNNKTGNSDNNYGQMIVLLIILVIWIVLVLLVGKYLWNECLCKVVTICKPMDNVFTFIGLVILFDMLLPTMG